MDTVIRSRTNALVKEFVRRRDDAARHSTWFVVEGAKLVAEAARTRHSVIQVFVLEGWEDQLPELPGAELVRVSAPVMEKLSELPSPSWVLALCRRAAGPAPGELLQRTPWLVLDGVQDPGNLGTILRSVEAFGHPPVILLPPAPSPFQEKVIRASTGSSLRVDYWRPAGHDEFLDALRREGVILCALHPDGELDLDHLPAGTSRAFVVGNEGHGLSPALAGNVARTVRIPMEPAVESLNAATSAALLLYHLYRSGSRRSRRAES